MNVVIQMAQNAPFFVRVGWARVFKQIGWNVIDWWKESCPSFDLFNKVSDIDLLICNTYDADEGLFRCLKAHPNTKCIMFASAWGELSDYVNPEEYPIVRINEKEKNLLNKMKQETGRPDYVFIHVSDKYLDPTMGRWRNIGIEPVGIMNGADIFSYLNGVYNEAYDCDIAFVGNRWPYKARNIDKFLSPLCCFPSKFKIKIFGGGGWDVNQYLGQIEETEVKNVMASAAICPNISEPHSTDLGFDCVERIFKVPLSGFLISDRVKELDEVFTNGEVPQFSTHDGLRVLVEHFLNDTQERYELMAQQRTTVLKGHTYFDRVKKMLAKVGLAEEANKCDIAKEEVLRSLHVPCIKS